MWTGIWVFSVLGPRLWNSLPSHNTTSFGHSLKTSFFSQRLYAYSAFGALAIMRYYHICFTYLLTWSTEENTKMGLDPDY